MGMCSGMRDSPRVSSVWARAKSLIPLVRVHPYIITIIDNIYLFIIELIIYYIDRLTLYMDANLWMAEPWKEVNFDI